MKRSRRVTLSFPRALIALCGAVLSLVAAVCTLVAAVVRFAARMTLALAVRVQRVTPPKAVPFKAVAPAKPALRLVPSAPLPAPKVQGPSAQERLTSALVNIGFAASTVRKYVASLGNNVEHEDIASLIKDGLRALAA